MAKDLIQKTTALFPEAFYDILSYLIPSAYLGLSIVFTLPERISSELPSIKGSGSFVYDFFIAILVFGALYLIGQLLTTFSYFVITKPVHLLSKKFGLINDIYFIDIYMTIKEKSSSIASLEITKRFARSMLSRNISFASLLIMLWNIFVFRNDLFLFFMVIFVLTLLDYSVRYRWLLLSMNTAIRGIE